MSLIFTGYYGQMNTGDDVFCIISDWAARKYWMQNDIKFFGRNLPPKIDGNKLSSSITQKKYFKSQYYLEVIIENGVNGFLIPFQNEYVYKTKIEKLMNEPDLREKFKENSIKIKDKLELEVIAKHYKEFISKTK